MSCHVLCILCTILVSAPLIFSVLLSTVDTICQFFHPSLKTGHLFHQYSFCVPVISYMSNILNVIGMILK